MSRLSPIDSGSPASAASARCAAARHRPPAGRRLLPGRGRQRLRWWCGLPLWLALAALPAQALERVSVQLRWVPQFQFAGYYVALERGYYRQAGLAVELRPGGPGSMPAIDAVVSGRADFGVSNSGLAVAAMNGRPVTAVAALLQESASVWLVRAAHHHKPLAELAALPQMRLRSDEEAVELLLPFVRSGIPAGQLRAVSTTYSVESFIRGDAQLYSAYVGNEPYELQQRGLDFRVVDPADHGVHFYGDVLFTSRQFADAHPTTVARLRDATLRGWREAFADVPGTARMIQARYAPARSLEHLVHEGEALRSRSGHGLIELGHMSPARWTAIAEQQRQLGFGAAPLPLDEFLFEARQRRHVRWPDPMRVTLVGLVGVLMLTLHGMMRTNRRLAREAVLAAERSRSHQTDELRFQFLMDVAPFPLLIYALDDGEVVYANERAQAWLGGGGEPAQVQRWLPDLGPGTPAMARLREGRLLSDLEIELPSGRPAPSRWALVTVRAIEYAGRACGFATLGDLSARKNAEIELTLLSEQRGRILAEVEQLQSRLRDASLRDALTGLYNRRYFDGTLGRELSRVRREGRPLALLVIDADHFKQVNDRFGHAGGDEVLRTLARLLQACHRDADMACRFGGEEFVLVLPGASAAVAMARGEALRAAVEASETATDGGLVRFTVSIGVAVTAAGDEAADALFRRADAAVYEAKRLGRNRVVLAGDGEAAAAAATAAVAGTAP